MEKNLVITILLIALILISGIQVIQLYSLKTEINGNTVLSQSSSVDPMAGHHSNSPASSSSSSMVGGC